MHNTCVDGRCVASCEEGLSACSGGCCSVKALSIFLDVACALKADGSTWCWEGRKPSKKPGVGNLPQENFGFTQTPERIDELPPAAEIAVLGPICVLGIDGVVTCKAFPPWQHSESPFVWSPRDTKYEHIYSNEFSSALCLLDDTAADCTPSFDLGGSEPTITTPGPWRAFSVGNTHECGLHGDGSVWCFGDDDEVDAVGGVLENLLSTSTPIEIPGFGAPVAAVTSGNHFSCGLRNDGTLACWGTNWDGQLGIGPPLSPVVRTTTPLDVIDLPEPVVAVSTQTMHTCALTSSHRVFCWGNFYCPSSDPEQYENEVASPDEITSFFHAPVSAIFVGGWKVCATLLGGGVECADFSDDGVCETDLEFYDVPGL